MSSLYTEFQSALAPHCEQHLKKVVLALSGGMDSRVLLELLATFKRSRPDIQCIAVHVHHGLSDNANEWAHKCHHWCEQLGISLFVEHVTIEMKSRTSIEKQARDARYQVLKPYISEGSVLLTGQHSDDQVETFLLALKRGSGPKGLSAMAKCMPFHHGSIVRPLLNVHRKDIEQYAQQNQLDWVEDESNSDTQFDRNFLRHNVTPQITERWPNFSHAVQRSAELCAEQEALLDELLTPTYINAINDELALSIETLDALSEAARFRLLRMWFYDHSVSMPSRIQLKELWNTIAKAQADANPKLTLGAHDVRRYCGYLYLLPNFNDISQWSTTLHVGQTIELPDNLGILTLQERSHVTEPLTSSVSCHVQTMTLVEGEGEVKVGFDPQGLSACPEERSGSRKLKKLLQEYRVPSWQRRRLPILTSGDQVIAVAGLFVSKLNSGQRIELIWRKPTSLMSQS